MISSNITRSLSGCSLIHLAQFRMYLNTTNDPVEIKITHFRKHKHTHTQQSQHLQCVNTDPFVSLCTKDNFIIPPCGQIVGLLWKLGQHSVAFVKTHTLLAKTRDTSYNCDHEAPHSQVCHPRSVSYGGLLVVHFTKLSARGIVRIEQILNIVAAKR